MTRRTPDDHPGGDFCEIEGEAPASGHVYHPIRSDDLVWLAKEVWSIMDAAQRSEFLEACDLEPSEWIPSWAPKSDQRLVEPWTAPTQQIPPGGAPVVWHDA